VVATPRSVRELPVLAAPRVSLPRSRCVLLLGLLPPRRLPLPARPRFVAPLGLDDFIFDDGFTIVSSSKP
jgi:hypothetical protein